MADNVQSYGYDANGNMTSASSGGGIFTYTMDNELESSTVNGKHVTYQYDADGWRVTRTEGTNRSTFLRGPGNQLMTEVIGSTTRDTASSIRDYIYAGGRLIAVVKNVPPGAAPAVEEFEIVPDTQTTPRRKVEFRAVSPVQVPLRSAALLRASASSSCTPSTKDSCYFTSVDSVTAPANVTEWEDNTALTDDTPIGSFVYAVKVTDDEGASSISTAALVEVSAVDISPDLFSFESATGVGLGATVESTKAHITGISTAVNVAITGGGSYRVCADANCADNPPFVTGTSTIPNNAYLQLRATGSVAFSTTVTSTITVGTSSASWSVTSIPAGVGLRGEYFTDSGNGNFYTTPTLERTDPSVDFTWVGSPGGSLPADNFSVRWTGQLLAPVSGPYIFTTGSDDGIRLILDGQTLIDNWTDHAPVLDVSQPVTLAAGTWHGITLEFYEKGGGARVQLAWAYPGQSTVSIPTEFLSPGTNGRPSVNAGSDLTLSSDATTLSGTATDDGTPGALTSGWSQASGPGSTAFANASQLNTTVAFSVPGNYVLRLKASDGALGVTDDVGVVAGVPLGPGGLQAQYYNDPGNGGHFTSLALTRTDPIVAFDWARDTPHSSLQTDNFSVRWSGRVIAPVTGDYVFSTLSDDGVRLWVNGVLMVDRWTDHAPTTDTSNPIALVAGQPYSIVLEYYEFGGGATVQLRWSYPGQALQVIPRICLDPEPVSGSGPDAFSFTNQTGVASSTLIQSNIVTPTGIQGTPTVSVSGGSYRVCSNSSCSSDPAWTTTAGTIGAGSSLQLRVTSSSNFNTASAVTVTIGSVSSTWTVTTAAQDTTPDPYSFVSQTGLAPNTTVNSNIVQITGITGSVNSWSVSSGGFRICSDATCSTNPPFINHAASITNGVYVQLQQASSASYGTVAMGYYCVYLNENCPSWSLTTVDQDTTPDPYSFPTAADVAPGSTVNSAIVQITGITGQVNSWPAGNSEKSRICTDATCSTNPAFSVGAKQIVNGSYIQLQQTASPTPGGSVTEYFCVHSGTGCPSWTVNSRPDIARTYTSGKVQASANHVLSHSWPSLPSVGQWLIVSSIQFAGGSGNVSIGDNQSGNISWTKLEGDNVPSRNFATIFYGRVNSTLSGTLTATITSTSSDANSYITGVFDSWTGLSASPTVLTAQNTSAVNATSLTSPTVSPTSAGVVYAVFVTNAAASNTTTAPATPWTTGFVEGNGNLYEVGSASYQIVGNSGGSFSGTFQITPNYSGTIGSLMLFLSRP